jgi:hypothetical protein
MKNLDNQIDDETRLVVTLSVREFKNTVLNLLNENILLKLPQEKPQEVKDLVPRMVVADKYYITPETLDTWVKLGIFPKPEKKGGRKYFYQSDLDSFNTAKTKNTNS